MQKDPFNIAENFVACVKRDVQNTYAPEHVDLCTVAHLQATLQILASHYPQIQDFLSVRIQQLEAKNK
jgi:hypothetical protein